jgi:hypothetical protein
MFVFLPRDRIDSSSGQSVYTYKESKVAEAEDKLDFILHLTGNSSKTCKALNCVCGILLLLMMLLLLMVIL